MRISLRFQERTCSPHRWEWATRPESEPSVKPLRELRAWRWARTWWGRARNILPGTRDRTNSLPKRALEDSSKSGTFCRTLPYELYSKSTIWMMVNCREERISRRRSSKSLRALCLCRAALTDMLHRSVSFFLSFQLNLMKSASFIWILSFLN